MSELDKRLEEILELAQSYIDDEGVQARARDVAIPAIKQAFIDDGWNKPYDNEGIINFGTEEQPILIHKDSLPFTPFDENAGFVEMPEGHNGQVLMTGQEWAERFAKSLPDIDSNKSKYTIYQDAIEAAKKASGIS